MKANKGVVPLRTDIVPALISRAAFENKQKGTAALKKDRKRIGAKSSLKFLKYSFLINIGATISEAINNL